MTLRRSRPESYLKVVSTVKQEPYTDPYVRFCERAGSRTDPRGSPYSIVFGWEVGVAKELLVASVGKVASC